MPLQIVVGRQPAEHHAARAGEDDADRLALQTLARQALQHRQGAAGQRRAGAGIANVAPVDAAGRDIPPPRTLPGRQDHVTHHAWPEPLRRQEPLPGPGQPGAVRHLRGDGWSAALSG